MCPTPSGPAVSLCQCAWLLQHPLQVVLWLASVDVSGISSILGSPLPLGFTSAAFCTMISLGRNQILVCIACLSGLMESWHKPPGPLINYFFFWGKILLCSPGRPRTRYTHMHMCTHTNAYIYTCICYRRLDLRSTYLCSPALHCLYTTTFYVLPHGFASCVSAKQDQSE